MAELGGLPNQKIHCSVLAVEGLKKVIAEYEKGRVAKVLVKKALSSKATVKKTLTKKTSISKSKK